MEVRSIFVDQRVQHTQSWNEGVFVYLDHTILMCEIMYPSKSRLERLACARDLRRKYERYNDKSENYYQMEGPNPNEHKQFQTQLVS